MVNTKEIIIGNINKDLQKLTSKELSKIYKYIRKNIITNFDSPYDCSIKRIQNF